MAKREVEDMCKYCQKAFRLRMDPYSEAELLMAEHLVDDHCECDD